MDQGSLPARVAKFIRSVVPEDPAQCLFLAGVICIVIAPGLAWLPSPLIAPLDSFPDGPAEQTYRQAGRLLALTLLPIVFAGVAAYFVYFWPGPRPARRVIWTVCAPVTAGLVATFGSFVYVSRPVSSILSSGSRIQVFIGQLLGALRAPPLGFACALLGLLLIAIFAFKLAMGTASLPLALPGSPVAESAGAQPWRRIQILTWLLVSPLFGFMLSVESRAFALLFRILHWELRPGVQFAWFFGSGSVAEGLLFLVVTQWLVGAAGRHTVRNSLRLPQARYLLLALSFSIGTGLLVPGAHYIQQRVLWAAQGFGQTLPPQPGAYFAFPDFWLLWMVFYVLAEEIAFRGLLLPGLIHRYGLARGIFLTGIAWAAFHFRSDMSTAFTAVDAILQLGFRVAICLAIGFVLAWLTLRSGSIFPAVLAHTFYNLLVPGSFGPAFPQSPALRILLWGALAGLLLRYWPVPAELPGGRAANAAM